MQNGSDGGFQIGGENSVPAEPEQIAANSLGPVNLLDFLVEN